MAKKIGIFDSGYGGLTILNEIRKALPLYDYEYLGDNARAPYGTRSFDVIYKYTLQAVQYLLSHDCTLVILACNTASAKALRTIQKRDLPKINGDKHLVNVLGVIRPTVEEVDHESKTRHVGVLATPATVSSESYLLEFQKVAPEMIVSQQECPLWVPLIEAGEHLNIGADYFVDLYLHELFNKDPLIDIVVLGCTHYPLMKEKIDRWLTNNGHKNVKAIPQGNLFANSLRTYLQNHPEYASQLTCGGTCRYLTTENADRFSQSASVFLAAPVTAEHIDLE
ncbi:MAG: glutamate racemase [Paludibacteraceae bacterium]|nr:glutamate racemase [Paludibacteraceae bacterium]